MNDIITNLQDLRHLSWTKSRKSSGTAGSFLKSYDDTGTRKKYYKLSDYDLVKGIVGHECVNEIIVQRLLDILNIPHLQYTLIHALIIINDREYETYLCESFDFKEYGEAKTALEDYYAMERKQGELPIPFCKRMGWQKYIYQMLIADYLILNRDRHGANIEVLRSGKEHSIRLAPLFDHGLSLCCSCHNEDALKSFDVMEDRRIQSFVASNSAWDNVRLVPKNTFKKIHALKEGNRQILFAGLNGIMSQEYQDKIWEMIWRRWQSLDDI